MSNFLAGSSDQEYHADRTHLSSSGLKLLLKDPARFHREYILGERPADDNPAFAEGKLVHTLILEPHKIGDYVVYPGARRSGKEFASFRKTFPTKTIVTRTENERARSLAVKCMRSDDVRALLNSGHAEYSMVATFAGVPVKARADYLDASRATIIDIKTTSKPTSESAFIETISQYDYDLSAALYCHIAGENFAANFDFYWVVASKRDAGVAVVKATPEDLRIGMEKVHRAIEIYKHCKQTGIWALPEPRKVVTMKSNTAKSSKGSELPLMTLRGKPYMQVAHRLVWFNDDVPRFNIETEFPLLTDEQTVCRARVILCSEHGEALKIATATKRETKKDFPDHTEKAETGAIGRALALLGFGTQFAIVDLDEGDRIVDSPVPTKKVAGVL